MKKLFISLIVLFSFVQITSAEVIKLRTSGIAYQYKNEYSGVWGDWGAWQDCNVLIVIDDRGERITIYSQETQEYDIITQTREDEDFESKSYYYDCIDARGLRCQVRLRIYDDYSRGSQLYIDYDDMRWVYSIFNN